MLRLAMEGWEGWRRALLIRWRRWRFLRGDTELDMIMEFLNKLLKMVIRLRFLIIGLKREILGKSNVRISLMKFVFMVILLSIRMVQLNVQDGKIAKKL